MNRVRHGLAAIVLAAGPWLFPGPVHASPAVFDLTVDDGRVTLRIADPVPVADVVAALAEAVGAKAVFRRNPGEVGPLQLSGVPVAETLQRLAGRNSLAVVHDKEGVRSIVLVGRGGQRAEPVVVVTPSPAPPADDAREQRSRGLQRVVELSYQADDEARSELLALTENPDPAIRRAAISALATLGGTTAVAAVDGKGLGDPDPSVRSQAARSLWQLLGRKAEPRLAAAAATETDPEVRSVIAGLLHPAR